MTKRPDTASMATRPDAFPALAAKRASSLAVAGPFEALARWATNSAGFMLESADTLPSTNWSATGQTTNVIAGYYYLDVTSASGGRFYRLRRP